MFSLLFLAGLLVPVAMGTFHPLSSGGDDNGGGAGGGTATIETSSTKWLIQSGGAQPSSYYARRGFTHQLVSSAAPLAPYTGVAGTPFVSGSAAERWRQGEVAKYRQTLAENTAAGLHTLSSMDIFVVPEGIVEANWHRMCEGCTDCPCSCTSCPKSARKRIALNNFTIRLMGTMLDESFATFPQLSGIVVRVGENYGGPHSPVAWVGNGAVEFNQRRSRVQAQYALFINALRDKVCVEHNKTLIFRTWDTSGFSPTDMARLHPSREYYANVTEAVAPHPHLIFSIKHVALDFWRFVGWNPSLATGRHAQIIEAECAREYEGKGAMPAYVADGIINGFPEMGARKVGLKHVVTNPQVVGLWLWTSGGGWAGPHVGNQTLWPMTNALVLARWWQGAQATRTTGTVLSEQAAFHEYCVTELVPNRSDLTSCASFHHLSLASQDAILATRYCTASDGSQDWQAPAGSDAGSPCGTVSCMPTNNWLRDDRLDGLNVLGQERAHYGNPGTIWWLHKHGKTAEAMAEKGHAVAMWKCIVKLARSVDGGSAEFRNELVTTSVYGQLLSAVIESGWRVMTLGYAGLQSGTFNKSGLAIAIRDYDDACRTYNDTLEKMPTAATPFLDSYEGGHNEADWEPGLGASVNRFRNLSRAEQHEVND